MSIFQTCPTFFTETKENQLWVFKFNMLEESSEYSTSKVGVFKIIKIINVKLTLPKIKIWGYQMVDKR